jgi:glycine/D-amino acid oxidase-like deaminating enzyme/nitrite reductase/ring-hydroxylating ferredoxin subunit
MSAERGDRSHLSLEKLTIAPQSRCGIWQENVIPKEQRILSGLPDISDYLTLRRSRVVASFTTKPVWQATAPETTYPPLSQDLRVDVAIVGGGITGLTTALLLKRAGLSVAVLEALHLADSVTAYTTGHISEVPDVGYPSLIDRFGEDKARLSVQARRAAIEQIAQLVQTEQIDCQFERVPGYLYTESYREISRLEEEAKAAQKLGVEASLTEQVPLPFPTTKGIVFPNQAQFNSVPYLQALAKAVNGDGSYVFEQTRVMNVSGEAVETDRGTVTAPAVVFATHTPIHDITRLQDIYATAVKVVPYQSYVLGVKLRSPAPSGLFWDTADPYHYTRKYNDPQTGEILIVGGEDHRTGEETNTLECYERLEAYVRSHFDVESIDYRWSSQWFEPLDGLPFIGKSLLHSNIYVATGYSGNGISFGTIAGMLISDSILDRENPWTDLYDPNRLKPIASTQFVAHNLNISKHFIADRFKQDAKGFEEIPPATGKIIEVDKEQIAAYRDESGTMHTVSAVCTHLGCIVNWNEAAKSWDCPCHGARFSCTGEVLAGPAVKNLDPKHLDTK